MRPLRKHPQKGSQKQSGRQGFDLTFEGGESDLTLTPYQKNRTFHISHNLFRHTSDKMT